MKNLKDKVVVITGAASGIGKALAQQFAKLGSHLALNDFNEEGLLETVKELQSITSGKVFSASFDVSKVENFEKFARQIFEEFGCVDIVINNAGVALGRVSIEDVSYKDFEWVMNINFWGMVYGTKTFLPLLKKQPEAALVNISSSTNNVTFNWTAVADSGITGLLNSSSTDTTFIPAETLFNSGNEPLEVTYTIYPILNSPTECPVDPVVYKVIVNPTPSIVSILIGCSYSTLNLARVLSTTLHASCRFSVECVTNIPDFLLFFALYTNISSASFLFFFIHILY